MVAHLTVLPVGTCRCCLVALILMPNKQQKLTEFDRIDSSDYENPWQCPACGTVCGSEVRPQHIRDCDEWGGVR
jgi:rubrerythrin